VWGAGRWTVRDAWGARWTFVLGARATADERGKALRGHAARRAVERIFGHPRDTDWQVLIDLADIAAPDSRHYTHAALKTLVETRVGRAGSLLLLGLQGVPLGRSSASTEPPGAMTEAERRVVAAITGHGDVIAEDGWQYRVVGVAAATAPSRNDGFERVRADEARVLVLRLGARPSVTLAARAAWKEAVDLLAEPGSPPTPGGLVLLRRRMRPSFNVAASGPASTPSALWAAAKQDITLKFLEIGTGRPIGGAALTLTGPDGNPNRLTTSSAGMVTLTALDPGQCTATSIIRNATADASFVPGASGAVRPAADGGQPSPIHPAWLVEVDEHRVKSGETPDSIARDVGVAWDDIAQFNWNTTDPVALQDFFRERVGCTRKTPDGKAYVFDDADDPGVILIPRPWTGAFAVGMTHTLLVAPLRSVYISLENESALPIPGAGYEAVFADGSVRHGRLGRSGIARLAAVPEGPFSVVYPDQQDLLARSLAVSTRRAFDQQATGPLFFMLGQEQAVIDTAVGVYQQYCNDLSGRGLVADIDQVVTDADARAPLQFLCALAGLPIEGSAGVTVQVGAGGSPDHG